jgi:hypothetical protein
MLFDINFCLIRWANGHAAGTIKITSCHVLHIFIFSWVKANSLLLGTAVDFHKYVYSNM